MYRDIETLFGSGDGTVGQCKTLPANTLHQSVAKRGPSASEILRDHRRRDMLASIDEFWRASGPDRTYWRRDVQHRLAEWRTLYRIPERAAFQQAVVRNQI